MAGSVCRHEIAGGCWLCRKYEPEKWGAAATLDLARGLGVKLGVDIDQDPLQIIAKPKERITDELREGIKANRDDLIRELLFAEAGKWVGSRSFSAPDDMDRQLNDAFYGSLEEYREALRAWAKAGLEAGKGKAAA